MSLSLLLLYVTFILFYEHELKTLAFNKFPIVFISVIYLLTIFPTITLSLMIKIVLVKYKNRLISREVKIILST